MAHLKENYSYCARISRGMYEQNMASKVKRSFLLRTGATQDTVFTRSTNTPQKATNHENFEWKMQWGGGVDAHALYSLK